MEHRGSEHHHQSRSLRLVSVSTCSLTWTASQTQVCWSNNQRKLHQTGQKSNAGSSTNTIRWQARLLPNPLEGMTKQSGTNSNIVSLMFFSHYFCFLCRPPSWFEGHTVSFLSYACLLVFLAKLLVKPTLIFSWNYPTFLCSYYWNHY